MLDYLSLEFNFDIYISQLSIIISVIFELIIVRLKFF